MHFLYLHFYYFLVSIITVPEIHTTVLPNGVRVISEQIPYVRSFSLGFWFNTGTRDENPGNNGIAHFIEHMLFKGTKKRSARKIAETIEASGGYLNAFTSKEHTCFYCRGLAENISVTFDVIADMVANPLFRQNHIRKESGVILDELNDVEDNPEELIFDKFEEILFRGSTLAYPILGTEQNIVSFTPESLFAHHSRFYGTPNLLIASSGNVAHEDLVRMAEKFFAVTRGTAPIPRRGVGRVQAQSVTLQKDIQQLHCILGCTSYGYSSIDRVKLNILSHILGEGSGSRLYQAVREKEGMTYQINSFINSYFDTSAFGVYFSTNARQADKVLSIISRELRKLRESEVPDKELRRIKEFIKGSMILSLENTSNRMIRMATGMLYYGRVIPVDEIVKRIDAVTAADICMLAGTVLDESSHTRLILTAGGGKNNAA